ncbi:MAG: cysteine--tRNA ligase [Clostridiales bacterium]|jgi:cysteinyl-tRNA synthetase|nr:cysteine--tRNA ligase [Clostridiales bacterium]
MKLFDTLARERREFIPTDPKEVTIYSCGPTVYSYAHIGNMRTYIFMDLLRRVLKRNGYKLKHVMNITDVGHLVSDADEGEDKLQKAASEQHKSPYEIAEFYTGLFFKDLRELNIETPEIVAKVTDYIDEMIDFVKILQEKGFAYEISDGIYFDISKFKDYGKLSGLNLEEQLAGARVGVNNEKRNPEDFALWKKAPKEHIMQWPSPWGMGYPGWHIECSTLEKIYFGDMLDIHTGGVDHIPIHHENEIAQSEAYFGKKTVNYWVHAEFLLVNGGKMGKSLGNLYTIDTLKEKGYTPLAYRYFCLNGNYRAKLNFTWDGLKSAQVSLNRLYELALAHKNGSDDDNRELIKTWKTEFNEAINDDLNIPLALGTVWKAARHNVKSKDIYDFLIWADEVLGLKLDEAEEFLKEEPDELEPELIDLIEKRDKAKLEKNYALADSIRDELKNRGIILTDTREGTRWERI